MEIKNAQIESTMLGREDHEIMTFIINVRFDSCSHIGIGLYALDGFDTATQTRVFTAKSMEAISRVLDVVGVNKWEDLPGKYIRIKDRGWGKTIVEIGNVMEDKWLNLEEFFKEA